MDPAADHAALRVYGRRVVSGEGEVFYFPIRHHSPACALHLRRALNEIRPRAIVLEMPADFAPLLPLLLSPETRPPVAIVSVAQQEGAAVLSGSAVAGYWPLSATAPEWVAIQTAARLNARLVMADLPASARPERHGPPGEPTVLTDERPLAYSDYAQGLVARTGARDFNEVWDRLFESRAGDADWRSFFADMGAHCALSRRTALHADMVADGTLAREAHMRDALAAALVEGGPVAVVTGGFHTPALLDPRDGAPEPPPSVPQSVPHRVYLVRYAHGSLDRLNGYASGMPSPRYYERLHAAADAGTDNPFDAAATDVLTGLAARLRREQPGFAPSLPSLIAALHQARGLADLRGLPGPGRSELLDAARSCFVKDEDPRVSPVMQVLHRELTGEGMGDVPRAAGSPPLVEAVRARARALGFKVDDGQERQRDLDLHRKDRHRAASRFLHLMELLGTGFGRFVQGPDWTGGAVGRALLIESWGYAWSPPVEGRLVELSGEGDTPERVGLAVLHGRAAALGEAGQGRDAAAAARLVLLAAQTGLAQAHGALAGVLAGAVAADPDPVRIVRCLGILHGLWGGQRVLGLTGSDVLQPLRAACYRRAVDLLPDLADVAPERVREAAEALAGLHHLLEDADGGTEPLDRELFDEAVAALLNRALPPLVGGVVAAVSHLAGRLDARGLTATLCGALGGAAADPADRAAPLSGLVLVQPALLRRCEPLLDGLDAVFEAMAEEQFLQVLPHLRLALTALDPHETDDLAARIAAMKGLSGPLLAPGLAFTEAEMLANARQSEALRVLLDADGLGAWHG